MWSAPKGKAPWPTKQSLHTQTRSKRRGSCAHPAASQGPRSTRLRDFRVPPGCGHTPLCKDSLELQGRWHQPQITGPKETIGIGNRSVRSSRTLSKDHIYDQPSLILKPLKSSLVTITTRYQTNSVLYHMQTICICVAVSNLLLGSLARILFLRL